MAIANPVPIPVDHVRLAFATHFEAVEGVRLASALRGEGALSVSLDALKPRTRKINKARSNNFDYSLGLGVVTVTAWLAVAYS